MTTPIVYLGFDPGAVTGIAWTSVGERQNVLTGHASPDPMSACSMILRMLKWYKHLEDDDNKVRIVVSGEAYTMGSSVRSHQPDALHILGAVRWMVEEFFTDVELRITGAADASRVGTRQTLTAAGWWIPGDPDQHRNRAAAQVAHAMMMTEPRRWYDLINKSDEGDQSDQATDHQGRTQVPSLEDPVG